MRDAMLPVPLFKALSAIAPWHPCTKPRRLPAKAIGLGYLSPWLVAGRRLGMPAMKVDCQLLTRALSGGSYCRLEESLLQFGGKFAPNCSNRFAEGCYNVVCRHSITFWLRSAATPRHATRGHAKWADCSNCSRGSRVPDRWLGRPGRTGWLSRQNSRPIGRRADRGQAAALRANRCDGLERPASGTGKL